MVKSPVSIECNEMRLEIQASVLRPDQFGYQLLIAGPQGWRPISAPANRLVRGSSFDLLASNVEQPAEDQIILRGKKCVRHVDTAVEYLWSAAIRADRARGWFHFDIEIESEADIPLGMIDGFEPEILLDLGHLPPYERGDHVWFMTNIANPTKWNDDAHGNDMPATYCYDAYLHAEILMFFDMTAMSWMSFNNVARFMNYRCGLRRRYQPRPAAEIGLYATGFSGKVFPAGCSQFAYSISAKPRSDTPTDQQAVRLLVERCLPLLPAQSDWPKLATTWQDFSLHCAEDLLHDEHCWRRDDAGPFMLNYVGGHSPAWKEAIEARGRSFDMIKPCLESAVWSAHPLSVLCAFEHEPAYHTLRERAVTAMRLSLASRKSLLHPPQSEESASGTWQYLFILEEVFQVARFLNDANLLSKIVHEVEKTVIPLAEKQCHLFPLSFDRTTLAESGSGDAHALLGTYASFMLDLFEFNGKQRYFEEATHAIRLLYALPVNTISQEVFLLGMGVSAAARLHALSNDPQFETIYRYLLAQTLRMMHWFNDRTTEDSRSINTLGMFQACATISYPAIFENVETLSRIAPSFKQFTPDENLLRVFDHARKNNFYFFPKCLPEKYATSPLQYVPLENIGILEGPAVTSVGQEIYGAGWVFRAYLLLEAFGSCDDREVMLLNLNAFEERAQIHAGKLDLVFIAFNPTKKTREANLSFPPTKGHAAEVSEGNDAVSFSNPRVLTEHVSVQLEPGQFRYFRVTMFL